MDYFKKKFPVRQTPSGPTPKNFYDKLEDLPWSGRNKTATDEDKTKVVLHLLNDDTSKSPGNTSVLLGVMGIASRLHISAQSVNR